MSRPAYIYTAGIVLQGLVAVALFIKTKQVVYIEIALLSIPSIVLTAQLERWYKHTIENKD